MYLQNKAILTVNALAELNLPIRYHSFTMCPHTNRIATLNTKG